jgi:hypothetical protein
LMALFSVVLHLVKAVYRFEVRNVKDWTPKMVTSRQWQKQKLTFFWQDMYIIFARAAHRWDTFKMRSRLKMLSSVANSTLTEQRNGAVFTTHKYNT